MAKKLTVREKNEQLKPLGKQLRHYGIVLSILPNEKQIVKISQTFGCSRLVYNTYLATRKEHYSLTKETLAVGKYKTNYLNPSKKTEEFSFLSEVDKFALESAVENVQDAFDRFHKGQNGFPKFKSKRKAKKSYTTKFTDTTSGGNIRFLDNKYIQIPIVKKVEYIKPKSLKNQDKLSKVMNGQARILSATVSQKGDRYYVSLCCEEVIDLVQPLDLKNIDKNKVTGLDLGLKDFAILNNGLHTTKIDNPKFFSKSEKKLAKLQKKFSKKKVDSKNFIKAKNKVNKMHNKIANQREDFCHKLSRKLTNENQVVVVENLNIKGMVKNPNLAKAISDAGWSKFLTFLKYKLEWEGKYYVEIDRWFASSKICSHCGEKKLMLALSEREWVCSCCQTTHDRDENASINIRQEGMRILGIA